MQVPEHSPSAPHSQAAHAALAAKPEPEPEKADHGLPKSRRLLKRAEFQRVMAQGQKAVTPYLIVIATPAKDHSPSRLGIIASKKVGNAVMRNKAKRRIRESFRQLTERIDGWDFVVIARAQAAVVPYSVVDYHLSKALHKCRKRKKS